MSEQVNMTKYSVYETYGMCRQPKSRVKLMHGSYKTEAEAFDAMRKAIDEVYYDPLEWERWISFNMKGIAQVRINRETLEQIEYHDFMVLPTEKAKRIVSL